MARGGPLRNGGEWALAEAEEDLRAGGESRVKKAHPGGPVDARHRAQQAVAEGWCLLLEAAVGITAIPPLPPPGHRRAG